MKKFKPLLLILSIIASLAVAGCSSSSKESSGTAKINEKEKTTVKVAIDTAADGSFQFRAVENQ